MQLRRFKTKEPIRQQHIKSHITSRVYTVCGWLSVLFFGCRYVFSSQVQTDKTKQESQMWLQPLITETASCDVYFFCESVRVCVCAHCLLTNQTRSHIHAQLKRPSPSLRVTMDTKVQDLKLSLPVMCTPLTLTNRRKELSNSHFCLSANFFIFSQKQKFTLYNGVSFFECLGGKEGRHFEYFLKVSGIEEKEKLRHGLGVTRSLKFSSAWEEQEWLTTHQAGGCASTQPRCDNSESQPGRSQALTRENPSRYPAFIRTILGFTVTLNALRKSSIDTKTNVLISTFDWNAEGKIESRCWLIYLLYF